MAVDITLLNSSNVNNINTNFERVKTALVDTLGRSGGLPNQMEADIDANGNDVLNIGTLTAEDISIAGTDVTGIIATAQAAAVAAELAADESEDWAEVAEGWADIAGGAVIPPGTITEAMLAPAVIDLINEANDTVSNLFPPSGRLTLTSNVPFPEADVTGATTVYYEAANGNAVSVYNGASSDILTIDGGTSLALDSDSGHSGYHAIGNIYDVFAYNNAGALAIGTGPTWAAGSTPGSVTNGASFRGIGASSTELETFNGMLVNKNSILLRFGAASGNTITIPARQATYLGSLEAIANGQTSDSKVARCLYNAYNQTIRPVALQIATASTYNYSTATFRQIKADASFLVKVLFGLAGGVVDVEFSGLVSNSTSTNVFVSVAIDMTGTTPEPLSIIGGASCNSTFYAQPTAKYTGNPGIGRHSIIPLEKGAGSDTQTWLEPSAGVRQTGLIGTVLL